MAVYSPAPSYPSIVPSIVAPSYSSPPHSSPSPPAPSPRHVSRSERMLLATLRRAEEHSTPQKSSPPDADPDYFSRAMDNAWSRSQSVNASPSHTYRTLAPLHAAEHSSRSHSPVATVRGVDRDGHHRGRTPSPSPHPYRTAAPHHPILTRTQTAPGKAQLHPNSRPSTPSQLPRKSVSPARHRPSAQGHHASTSSLKRTAHEELLRTRLESVLAKQQQQQDAAMDTSSIGVSSNPTTSRSRGASFTRTAPSANPNTTVGGDQWLWSQQNAPSIPALHLAAAPSSPKASTRRSPSITRVHPQRTGSSTQLSGMVSPSRMRENNVMITPPPSPPYGQNKPLDTSASTSSTPSRAPSQGRQQLGLGRPSAVAGSSSRSSSCTRVTPPPFDARSASLALKQQHGYVSFCEVAGLGEPEGMDGDDSEDEEGDDCRGRGKWWEVWRK